MHPPIFGTISTINYEYVYIYLGLFINYFV